MATSSPLELARAPAFVDDKWRIPDRYNFTRDLVEVLAANPKRQALTFVGPDSVIEPRTFHDLAEGANKWAYILRERGTEIGDRVLVLSGATVDWVEIMLGCIKAGAVPVPCPPYLSASALEARVSVSGASLIVATDEAKSEIAQMAFAPEVHHIFEGRRRRATDVVEEQPSADGASRDIALLVWTSGTSGAPKPVAHTHAWTFAARNQAAHWLDAGPRDVVWCTAPAGSAQALLGTLFGPWACGAEVVLRDGPFDPMERLELVHRFQTTILCQSPEEYRALAERHELPRFRSPRLRRLVSTGDYLEPDVIATFEEAWGLTIHNGYSQTETGVVLGDGRPPVLPEDVDEDTEDEGAESPPAPSLGSLGHPLPGHHVAIIDEQGNELPPGVEGSLAVRGRPPTLFAGYWDSPDETRDVFRGDWYVTGDVAVADEHGYLWFVGRSEDVIASSGRTFGPHDVERALRAHRAVSDSGVVGIRDLQRGGHFVRGFVVLEPGVEASEQLEAELREFAAESVVEQQVPREIVFVDELPRSPSGAIRRGELRDRPVADRPLWAAEREPEPAASAAPTSATVVPPPVEPVPQQVVEPVVEPVAEAVPTFEPLAVSEPAAVPPPELPLEPIAPPPAEPPAPTAYAPAAPLEEDATRGLAPEPVPAPETAVETVAEAAVAEPPPVEAEAEPAPAPPEHEPPSAAKPAGLAEPEPTALAPEPDETAFAAAHGATVEEPVSVAPEFPAWPEPVEALPPEPAAEPEAVEAEPAPEIATAPAPDEPALEPAAEAPAAAGAPWEPEPLPDYIVDPDRAPAPAPPPAPEPAWPEPEEEDLGPLPDFVVDPDRRLEVVPDPEPAPAPPPAPSAPPEEPEEPSLPAFPPTPVLDLGSTETAARAGDDGERSRRPRRRPQAAEAARAKPSGSAAEPGDEAGEASWMQGLSSRLSHYSLGADEPRKPDDVETEKPEKAEDAESA